MVKYYSTQRPVSPGTFPREGAGRIVNFDNKQFCEEIGRDAWGYFTSITSFMLSLPPPRIVQPPPGKGTSRCKYPFGSWAAKSRIPLLLPGTYGIRMMNSTILGRSWSGFWWMERIWRLQERIRRRRDEKQKVLARTD